MSDWIPQFKARFASAILADTEPVAKDCVVNGVAPACRAAPQDEGQAAEIIRFAAAWKIPVVPCGGGTSQGVGAPPPSDFLALSTRGLNKLTHHEPGDMVATVQSGMMVSDFQNMLRARGQWLPIDAAGGATIGGIVAANIYGPRALGFGTLRDMVLGMTVINGDGVIRKCGGKVVKNVTGYALDKLYIGSLGTLGLITEVTFKLRPISIDGRYWLAKFESLAAGVAALRAISSKNLPLEMLRVIRAETGAVPTLWISASGTEAELQRIDNELSTVMVACKLDGMHYADEPASGQSREEFAWTQSWTWSAHELRLLDRSRARNRPGALLRFGSLASKLDAALTALAHHENSAGSIGINGGMIDLVSLTESESAGIAREFEKLGINFSFENITGLKIENRFGSPRPEWAIMKQLKAALDPQGIMNPGRFVV